MLALEVKSGVPARQEGAEACVRVANKAEPGERLNLEGEKLQNQKVTKDTEENYMGNKVTQKPLAYTMTKPVFKHILERAGKKILIKW